MAHAERAPLLGARVSRDSGREDDLDDVFLRRRRRRARDDDGSDDDVSSSSTGPIDERERWRKSSIRRHWFALAACALVVMSSAMMVSTTVAFVRAAADASRAVKVRARRFGVAPRAREVLSVDALARYPWLAERRTSRNSRGSTTERWWGDDDEGVRRGGGPVGVRVDEEFARVGSRANGGGFRGDERAGGRCARGGERTAAELGAQAELVQRGGDEGRVEFRIRRLGFLRVSL